MLFHQTIQEVFLHPTAIRTDSIIYGDNVEESLDDRDKLREVCYFGHRVINLLISKEKFSSGSYISSVSKLLHFERPELFPIFDSHLNKKEAPNFDDYFKFILLFYKNKPEGLTVREFEFVLFLYYKHKYNKNGEISKSFGQDREIYLNNLGIPNQPPPKRTTHKVKRKK